MSVPLQQLRALSSEDASSAGTLSPDVTALAEKLNKLSLNATPGVVAVPSGDKGEFATLRFGLQHFVAEASKFKLRENILTKPNELATAVKKIRHYLSAAEKQIGAENVEHLRVPFFREVFCNTSLEYFAEDPDSSWREILNTICDLFEITEDDEIELFHAMLCISPCESVTIKQALIKIIGIIKKAQLDQAVGILPPAAVISRKVISWYPPTSKALIPHELFEVNHLTTWDEFLPSITNLARTTPADLRSSKAKEQSKKPSAPPPPPAIQSAGVRTTNRFEPKPFKRSDSKSPPSKTESKVFEVKPKKLGRLIRHGSSTDIEFRIDTGADEHCFGKDLIPYVERRKPTQSSYQVLLNSKTIKVEEGELLVSASHGNTSKLLRLKGIINAANNMSVLSTTTCNIVDGKGTFLLSGNVAAFPCYARDGFAYSTFRVVGIGKTYESTASMLGFLSAPKATAVDFTTAIHLKLGCAGIDTLCDTMAILGYSMSKPTVTSVVNNCSRCIAKTFFQGPVLNHNDPVDSKKEVGSKLLKAADPSLIALVAPIKHRGVPTALLSAPAKRPKVEESATADSLNSFLFGAVDSVYDNEILVFDHAILKSSYLLCAKLERRGFYFVDVCQTKSDLDLITKILTTFKNTIKTVHCDKAREFLTIEKKCNELGIVFVSSPTGRDEFKGRHEATVKVVKTMFAQVIDRLATSNPEYAWHPKLSAVSTAFLLNTRASPARKSIPWFTTFEKRPRYDLHLFREVFVVQNTKIVPGVAKGERGIFIGQTNPTHGWYLPLTGPSKLQAKEADISSFRQPKVSPEDYVLDYDRSISSFVYDDAKFFGALSSNARSLTFKEKRGNDWSYAVQDHCEKLLKYNAFSKATSRPTGWGNAFFVGRMMDGITKARLVCNGALTSDVPLDSSLPSVEERRLFFLLTAIKLKQNWVVSSGDISGAYYNTPGSGFLKLPHNWPNDLGGFLSSEIVSLNCAIPGDSLSSGLFLAKLSSLLSNNGYDVLVGSIRYDSETYILNYSDDVLVIGKNKEAIEKVSKVLNSHFSIEFEYGLPKRWVSCEFSLENNILSTSLAGTASSFTPEPIKFTLNALENLQLTDKLENEHTSNARSWIGKLNYLVTGNPYLCYYVSFLSSALHYDPERSSLIAQSLIQASTSKPFLMTYQPFQPKALAIYTDASHTLKTGRAHCGHLIQLQSTTAPEPFGNVIHFGSERLAKLYNSVYAAEIKAIENGIKHYLKLRNTVVSVFKDLEVVLFNDNKAAVTTLNNDKEPHPFVTESVDIVRQLCVDNGLKVTWVASQDNLSDCLTKPQKWF